VSRNAANHGQTVLIFYDAAGRELLANATSWSADGWQYNADPMLTATAPAGATSFRVRYGLNSPNEYADLDLLTVRVR
jgi:hypothetical protein